jgi:3-oxoadipate CoA-transferase alpha subunit
MPAALKIARAPRGCFPLRGNEPILIRSPSDPDGDGIGAAPAARHGNKGGLMPDRVVDSYRDAVAGLRRGDAVMLGGFGAAGVPLGLIAAGLALGVRDLTVIANNAGFGGADLTSWIEAGMVSRVICSYPRTSPACVALWQQGRLAVEVLPQGTLVERMRCAGAGLGGAVSVGTVLAEGKESRVIDGREYVLELPLRADMALIRAHRADRFGNLTYRMTARNFAPMMATAAKLVAAECAELVEPGGIDPEHVVTPGIFVDRVVMQGSLAWRP